MKVKVIATTIAISALALVAYSQVQNRQFLNKTPYMKGSISGPSSVTSGNTIFITLDATEKDTWLLNGDEVEVGNLYPACEEIVVEGATGTLEQINLQEDSIEDGYQKWQLVVRAKTLPAGVSQADQTFDALIRDMDGVTGRQDPNKDYHITLHVTAP